MLLNNYLWNIVLFEQNHSKHTNIQNAKTFKNINDKNYNKWHKTYIKPKNNKTFFLKKKHTTNDQNTNKNTLKFEKPYKNKMTKTYKTNI